MLNLPVEVKEYARWRESLVLQTDTEGGCSPVYHTGEAVLLLREERGDGLKRDDESGSRVRAKTRLRSVTESVSLWTRK